jgi:hypothetical protein
MGASLTLDAARMRPTRRRRGEAIRLRMGASYSLDVASGLGGDQGRATRESGHPARRVMGGGGPLADGASGTLDITRQGGRRRGEAIHLRMCLRNPGRRLQRSDSGEHTQGFQ